MSRTCIPLLISVVALLPWPIAAAGLEWETSRIEQVAAVGDEDARIQFPYHNTGDYAVTIVSVSPGCGCTEVSPGRIRVAPGEKGLLTFHFRFEDRVGKQTVKNRVITDDRRNRNHDLEFTVDIPETIKLRPRALIWRSGDVGVTKSVQMEVHSGIDIQKLEINPPQGLTVDWSVTEDNPRQFTINLTRVNSDRASAANVEIIIHQSKEEKFTHRLLARLL